jgi:hypothetical protein
MKVGTEMGSANWLVAGLGKAGALSTTRLANSVNMAG